MDQMDLKSWTMGYRGMGLNFQYGIDWGFKLQLSIPKRKIKTIRGERSITIFFFFYDFGFSE